MKLIPKPRFDVFSLERPALSRKEANASVARLARLAQILPAELAPRTSAESKATARENPVLADEAGRFTFAQFGQHAHSQVAGFLNRAPHFEPIELHTNTRVHGPPYDLNWSTGAAFGGRLDGKMITAVGHGFCAGGLGLTLRSPERVFVTVTPIGDYEYSWASLANLPRLSSAGGLGTVVYRQAKIEPGTHRQSVLWRINGALPFTGGHDARRLSQAISGGPEFPAQSFPFPLVPVRFTMEPDTTYEFWIWAWQQASLPAEGAPFLAFLRCNVPAITVTTEPPNFPPLH